MKADPEEFEFLKRRIAAGFKEYQDDLKAYLIWKNEWRQRQAAEQVQDQEQARESERRNVQADEPAMFDDKANRRLFERECARGEHRSSA
jgi:hypothetical protein